MDLSSIPGYLPQLLPGLLVSFELLAAIVVIGTPLALLLAVAQRSSLRVFRWTGIAFMEIGRGMPGLILVYLIYFGLPVTGLKLEAFAAAALALGLNYAAYTCEALRSGLDAVPIGQSEAAEALGLSRRVAMQRVILPQAVRIVTPPLLSWVIVYFQATSLAFAISVPELMSVAYSIAASNFQYLNLFVLAGVLYAVISIPGSQIVAALEKRQQSALR